MSEEITEVEDTKQSFDYRKEREERIKNKSEKAIFSELRVKSIDEIKSIFDSVESFKKQISDLEEKVKEGNLNKNRLEVLKSGIDDEFVDFVVDSLNKQVSDTQDFSSLLSKFKEEHPKYLKNYESTQIKLNTSPNFEGINKSQDFSHAFSNAVRNKLKER